MTPSTGQNQTAITSLLKINRSTRRKSQLDLNSIETLNLQIDSSKRFKMVKIVHYSPSKKTMMKKSKLLVIDKNSSKYTKSVKIGPANDTSLCPIHNSKGHSSLKEQHSVARYSKTISLLPS